MTPDLTWLAWTAALTAVLWIPYIVGQVITTGIITPGRYRDPTPPEMPAWVKRCDRAHINAVESLAPFAIVVLNLDSPQMLFENRFHFREFPWRHRALKALPETSQLLADLLPPGREERRAELLPLFDRRQVLCVEGAHFLAKGFFFGRKIEIHHNPRSASTRS